VTRTLPSDHCTLVTPSSEDRASWLRARKTGIGSSDASALVGANPWQSRLAVWLDKTSDVSDDTPPSRAMMLGNHLEEAVAQLFTHETGKAVTPVGMVRSKKWPFMMASCDRVLVDERAVLECKTTAWHQAKEWENDEIPNHALIQTIHQLAVTGLPRAYVAVLIGGGDDFQIRTVERDDAAISGLVELCEDFWTNYVQTGVEPRASQASDFQLMSSIRQPVDEQTIPTSVELQGWLRERAQIRSQKTELERRYQLVSARIIQELDGASAVVGMEGEPLCTYREIKRSGYTVEPKTIRQLKLTNRGREYFNG